MIEPLPSAVERRGQARKRAFNAGVITIGDQSQPDWCLVTDLSAGGACLQFVRYVRLPSSFSIEIGRTFRRRCKVQWQRGVRAGISFE